MNKEKYLGNVAKKYQLSRYVKGTIWFKFLDTSFVFFKYLTFLYFDAVKSYRNLKDKKTTKHNKTDNKILLIRPETNSRNTNNLIYNYAYAMK